MGTDFRKFISLDINSPAAVLHGDVQILANKLIVTLSSVPQLVS